MLNKFKGAKYFTALDLMKGFHQVVMSPCSVEKTAFVTPLGQFEFLKMPFGLHTAPSVFQYIVQDVLSGLEEHTMVYIDDIIIFSNSFEEHCRHVKTVLDRLYASNLKVNLSKCEFFRTQLLYLGFIINSTGIHTDPKKVAAVKNMPLPSCVKELQTFLGKAIYLSLIHI